MDSDLKPEDDAELSHRSHPSQLQLLEGVSKKPIFTLFLKIPNIYFHRAPSNDSRNYESTDAYTIMRVRILGDFNHVVSSKQNWGSARMSVDSRVSQCSKIYVVAKDLCAIIHTRKGNVAKSIGNFSYDQKARTPVICPRSNGSISTHVLTVLNVAGMYRLLHSSRSPLAPATMRAIYEGLHGMYYAHHLSKSKPTTSSQVDIQSSSVQDAPEISEDLWDQVKRVFTSQWTEDEQEVSGLALHFELRHLPDNTLSFFALDATKLAGENITASFEFSSREAESSSSATQLSLSTQLHLPLPPKSATGLIPESSTFPRGYGETQSSAFSPTMNRAQSAPMLSFSPRKQWPVTRGVRVPGMFSDSEMEPPAKRHQGTIAITTETHLMFPSASLPSDPSNNSRFRAVSAAHHLRSLVPSSTNLSAFSAPSSPSSGRSSISGSTNFHQVQYPYPLQQAFQPPSSLAPLDRAIFPEMSIPPTLSYPFSSTPPLYQLSSHSSMTPGYPNQFTLGSQSSFISPSLISGTPASTSTPVLSSSQFAPLYAQNALSANPIASSILPQSSEYFGLHSASPPINWSLQDQRRTSFAQPQPIVPIRVVSAASVLSQTLLSSTSTSTFTRSMHQ